MFETNFFTISKLLKEYGEPGPRKPAANATLHHWKDWREVASEAFKANDIIDARGFAQKLREGRDPLSQYLFGDLSAKTKSLLTDWNVWNVSDIFFREALSEDLNRICQRSDLYDKDRFQHVVLSSAPRGLLSYANNPVGIRQLNRVLLEEAYPQELANGWFQLSKIQMTNHKGYEYVKDRDNKYFYLQCLLHGAVRLPDEDETQQKSRKSDKRPRATLFEDAVRDFLIKELQLLFGMYCFIDPTATNEKEAPSFYLLGSLSESDLKPSFTFPHFVNARNIRNTREFHKLPDDWLEFYLNLNAATREKLTFTEDQFRFFGDKQNFRRNEELEQTNNFFYASSGEMDHTILQWLFCSLELTGETGETFAIPLSKIIPDAKVLAQVLKSNNQAAGTNSQPDVIRKIVRKIENEYYLNGKNPEPAGVEDFHQSIEDWFKCFGLLSDHDGTPTERLLAAIEFFYFHIKSWLPDKIGKNTQYYFSRDEHHDHFYGRYLMSEHTNENVAEETGEIDIRRSAQDFITKCEENLPVSAKSYAEIKDKIRDDKSLRTDMNQVLASYLVLMGAFAHYHPNREEFASYGRFNIVSHFFQRNVLPLFNPLLKEQTCRGFIIFPIFSNPHESTAKEIKNVGYFLGLIKDSDSKGRCYFNWRTHSDNITESETGDFFYKEYLFRLQDFVYNLGFKEVKQIYYKGIEAKNIQEVKKHASRAAISQVMARNMDHNIGSHVLSRYKSPADFDPLPIQPAKQYLAKALRLNQSLNQSSSENGAIQRAHFNEYLKNRMDFLADIATTDPTLETPLYLLQDVLANFDKNRILLDRISGLDSNVEFDVKLLRRNEKGTKEEIDGRANNRHSEDILVSLPNDILGSQAFYIIQENIIRNTTKHSRITSETDERPGLKFDITLRLETYADNESYYQVSVWDSFFQDQHQMNELVEKRNEMIKSPVLDGNTNKLRDFGLGSIEMLVCAAYLRRIPLDLVEDDFYRFNGAGYSEREGEKIPNILVAYAEPRAVKENLAALGYRFYIKKPQKLLVIDDRQAEKLSPLELAGWRAKGIVVKAAGDLEPHHRYSHEFLIWLNSAHDLGAFLKTHGTNLPRRVLTKKHFGADRFQLNGNLTEIEALVWKVYLRELFHAKRLSGTSIETSTAKEHFRYDIAQDGAVQRVFVDNHDKSWEKYLDDPKVYYEMLHSHHRFQSRKLRHELDESDEEAIYRRSWLEVVVSRVIIIDERIQSNVEDRLLNGRVPFQSYLENLGVLIPKKTEVNLNQINFHDPKNDVATNLRDYLGKRILKADFCVLHLGVIEKLFDQNKKVNARELERQITKVVGKENRDKVVITTGRGKPTNVSKEFRYIPLAIIQNAVETLFDKYMLVKALHNARRSK